MFRHNFKYSLKVLFKNKAFNILDFLPFPIILGIFFNMAFSNIENSEKLKVIDIAIIDNQEFNENENFLKQVFQNLSDEKNENRMFNTKYVSLEKAKEMLKNEDITGYILFENKEAKIQ